MRMPSELSLIPTDLLLAELRRRFDCVALVAAKVQGVRGPAADGPLGQGEMLMYRWSGPKSYAYGLACQLTTFLGADQGEDIAADEFDDLA